MRKAYATGPNLPNFTAARAGAHTRKTLRLNARVSRVARELFTLKTAQTLAALTGYSERACEYWLAGTVAIPGDALAALLRSEFGRNFLEAVMDQSPAAWWQSALSYFGILDAMRFQRNARRKLKAALDADDDLRSAISRSEAALCVQDEEFFGAHFDAVRATQRVPAGAMASSSRRGRQG